jgi:hypothetical protein
MPGVNVEALMQQLNRLHANQRGVAVPEGDYVTRLVSLKKVIGRGGRPLTIAILEITDGTRAGENIETPVWGNAERLFSARGNGLRRFCIRVYAHRVGGGREQCRVNVEAIRECGPTDGGAAGGQQAADFSAVGLVATDFTHCFRCIDSISARREIVEWHSAFGAMAQCERGAPIGKVVYLSTFTFTAGIGEHQAANDGAAKARGEKQAGSLAGYSGACFAPLLTFDTDCRNEDGEPDPEGCHVSAVSLVAVLVELGVDPALILVFFSGSKGFHVQFPSMAVGATPAPDFHLVAKEFCSLVAGRAGVVIDESLYRVLQPFRAPNSRHEKTGLYKVALTVDELVDLPFEAIRDLARQPRPFAPPSCQCEPVPEIVALWRQAEAAVRSKQSHAARLVDRGDDEASISRATWDYLINGAVPGTRAESHFKAAANLADFGSREELIHALMKRPAVLSGWPAREAAGHVNSALQRAAAGRRQTLQKGVSTSPAQQSVSPATSAGEEHGGAATSG